MCWNTIEQLAQPGDVLLLRREFPEGKQCVLELIHALDETYDHAALVMPPDSQGRLMIAHATKDAPTVASIALDEYPSRDHCVRAELLRHVQGSPNPNAGEIVSHANADWSGVKYAYGELLLAGLAASATPPRTPRDGVKAVLRARVLALCIVVLSDELASHTGAVTCASFVKTCYDGNNELAGPFTTIDRRLQELARGFVGGVDWFEAAKDLLELYRRRLHKGKTPVYDLMNETLCPHSVTADERAPEPDLLTYFSLSFLRLVERLPVAVPTNDLAPASGPPGASAPAVRATGRLLVTIEDLRTDANLKTIAVAPRRFKL
jgi:hypothetical protein